MSKFLPHKREIAREARKESTACATQDEARACSNASVSPNADTTAPLARVTPVDITKRTSSASANARTASVNTTNASATNAYDGRSSARVIFGIFLRDMKRIVTSPIALVVYLGLILLPCMYAWYCIAANWDPYSNTANVSIAVAINDKPATSELAGEINIGETLRTSLEENTQLGWTFVSEDEAIEGVTEGTYYAALVIPEDFSACFAGIFEGKGVENPPTITYYVNEKKNGVAVKVTDTGASGIENQINQNFVAAVDKVLAEKISDLTTSAVDKTRSTRNDVVSKLSDAQSALDSVKSSLSQASSTLEQTRETVLSCRQLLVETRDELQSFSEVTDSLLTSLNLIDSNLGTLIENPDQIPVLKALKEVLESARTSVQESITTIERLDENISTLPSTLENAITLLDQVDNSLSNLESSGTTTSGVIDSIKSRISDASARISSLSLSRNAGALTTLLNLNGDSVAEFMKKPVELITERIFPVENYGTGVAPFYTNLAIWVGAFILASLFRVEVQSDGKRPLRPRQAYLARGLLFSLTSMFQGMVICIGDLVIGIQCENPVLFVVTGMLLSIAYANIIYMLVATLKHVGKAASIVLLIMQIPGSSGMYPIELMPHAFQVIHPLLPFTYGIGAMRETIVGFYSSVYVLDLLCIVLFAVIALAIGLFVRPAFLNLTLLFDEQLSETDVVSCDPADHVQQERQTLRSVVRMLFMSEEYHERTEKRIVSFERNYERNRRRGIIGMAVGPLSLLVIMSIVCLFVTVDINTKVILMFVWVLALGIAATYLVVLEAIHKRFSTQADLLALGDESLVRRIAEQAHQGGDA